MSKSVVSIVKGNDAYKMVPEALGLLGGIGSIIKPKSTVVIKPNAGHLGSPETSVNTSPAMVSAAIKEVKKAGPKKIILAESSAVGCDTWECLKASGIAKAAEEAGVDDIIDIKSEKELINLPIRDARSDLTKVALPRFLVEAQHIVNLPIFKSHVSMVFTCALKNIKGVVQDKVHYLMHQTNLAAAMMDIWSVIKADLTIADLIRPMEGFGPHAGIPHDLGCVVASKDPVALDATACRMVGLDQSKVQYFQAAEERGLGNSDFSKIELRGAAIEDVYQPLYLPYLEGFEQWPEYNIFSEHACSSCLGLVAFTMAKLKFLDAYDKNQGINIILGRKKELPPGVETGRNLILIGDCTKPLRKKIKNDCIFAVGCPPVESFPWRAIVDREDQLERQPGSRERLRKETEIFMEKLRLLRDEGKL